MVKSFSTAISEPNVIEKNYKASKRKVNIFVYSIRKHLITITFCLFAICLVLFSTNNLAAAKNGLFLWATSVVPALFPFFVATELLNYTNIISILGKYLTPIIRFLFNVPGEASFAFLMGIISGYPVGAKIVSGFKEENICTKEEAERMLAFTNNSGPLFIVGTVGITLFGSYKIGILLLVTHILACISVGILLNIFAHSKTHNVNKHSSEVPSKSVSFSSLGEILSKSITNSISTIFLIGGFVVIFSVIISILNESHLLETISNILNPILHISPDIMNPFLSGFIELTNGVNLVSGIATINENIKIILCAFLLGFGGISVLLQVFSIISRAGLSIKTYFIGKLFQGFIAAFYTYIALQLI